MKPLFAILICAWIGLPTSFLAAPNGIAAEIETSAGQRPAERKVNANVLKLDDLMFELLRANPDLQAARKRFEAALTRPRQQSALPDPKVTFGWNSNGSPLPGYGLGTEPTSNIGFQISQEFPYPGKRTLREAMARKESESEAQSFRELQLNLVAQLKSTFHDLRFSHESIDLLNRNLEVLRRLAEVAELRYSLGKGVQQDLIKSQIEISILEKKLILEEQRKSSLEAALNALLNRPPAFELGRPEPVAAVPNLLDMKALALKAEQASPLLRSQQSVVDGRHFGVQMARKEYYPDFDVMSGYYNMGRMKDMWEFRLQLNVPIYFWRKQRYELEESTLRLVEAQKAYRAAQQSIQLRLREQYLAAESARKLMELYSQRIVPQARLALESSLASYESGALDFLSVLSNFNTILDYEMNYYEQRADYLKLLAGLEAIVAVPLEQWHQSEVKP